MTGYPKNLFCEKSGFNDFYNSSTATDNFQRNVAPLFCILRCNDLCVSINEGCVCAEVYAYKLDFVFSPVLRLIIQFPNILWQFCVVAYIRETFFYCSIILMLGDIGLYSLNR